MQAIMLGCRVWNKSMIEWIFGPKFSDMSVHAWFANYSVNWKRHVLVCAPVKGQRTLSITSRDEHDWPLQILEWKRETKLYILYGYCGFKRSGWESLTLMVEVVDVLWASSGHHLSWGTLGPTNNAIPLWQAETIWKAEWQSDSDTEA